MRERIAGAGRDPAEVEILAAVKYVPRRGAGGAGASAGLTLVGRTAPRSWSAKAAALADRFTWDFIGHLQSRKVRDVLPPVRYIHSVATDSVLRPAGAPRRPTSTEVLIEVNVAGEPGKSGIAPAELPALPGALPGAGGRA